MTLSARMTGNPRAGTAGPSKSQLNTIAGTIVDPSFVSADWAIVFGKSTSAPATFADLTGPQSANSVQMDRMTLSFTGSNANIVFTVDTWDLSALTIGDHLWLAYFRGNSSPSGTDPVTFSADLGLVVA